MLAARVAFLIALPFVASGQSYIIQRNAGGQIQSCTAHGTSGNLCCNAGQSGSLNAVQLCFDTTNERVKMNAYSYGYYQVSAYYNGYGWMAMYTSTAAASSWPLFGGQETVTGEEPSGSFTFCHSGSQCCSGVAGAGSSCTASQMGALDAVTMEYDAPCPSAWAGGPSGTECAPALSLTTIPHPGASYGSTHYEVTLTNSPAGSSHWSTFIQGTGGPFSNEYLTVALGSSVAAGVSKTNVTLV